MNDNPKSTGALDDLRHWVASLSKSEKRAVSLLGKAKSGDQPSQHLQLFHWLNQVDPDAKEEPDPSLVRNLPTLGLRLRELVGDSLVLQHKDATTESTLTHSIATAHQLSRKGLFPAAKKLLRQAKRDALAASQYVQALHCNALEAEIARSEFSESTVEQLESLYRERLDFMQRLQDFQELEHRYDQVRARSRNFISLRSVEDLAVVRTLVKSSLVEKLAAEGGYVERSMAINMQGILLLYEQQPGEAVRLYRLLLMDWGKEPIRAVDQGLLLYNISVMYLAACLTDAAPWSVVEENLKLLPNADDFDPFLSRHYLTTIYLHQFALALNRGELDYLQELSAEASAWVAKNEQVLPPRIVLATLHNLAVTAFFIGQFDVALRYVQRVLNFPNPGVRQDIADFAMALRAILLYQLGDNELLEYLARGGKRFFNTPDRAFAYELPLFRCLERAIRGNKERDKKAAFERLRGELTDLLAQLPGSVPLLGLMEVRIWVDAVLEERPIRAVFLDAVRANLDRLSGK